MILSLFVVIAVLQLTVCEAQDPATGWMAYAVGVVPEGVTRITKLSMSWKVSANPVKSRSFFSPWFGMDPADNLNLIQPVNPWSGSAWSMYTEYYQWKPTHNSNSPQHSVEAGQTLVGTMTYDATTDSYDLSQKIDETGVSSVQNIPCQNGKKYNLPYIVYEKTFPCQNYPPDEAVNFYNIYAECDGKDCTNDIKWESKIKDANCDMKAVVYNNTNISITWDTSLKSIYDNMEHKSLVALNAHGWAKHYHIDDNGDLQTKPPTPSALVSNSKDSELELDSNKMTCSMCKSLLPYVHTHECKSECKNWWSWTISMCESACNELTKYAPTTCCWDAGYCPKPY
jgi:hypothetical protein